MRLRRALNVTGVAALFAIPLLVRQLVDPTPLFMTAPQSEVGEKSLSSLQITIACSFMLLGILFGHMHEALRGSKPAVSIQMLLRESLSQPGLYRSLFASPIIFGGVYTALLHFIDPVMATIFAFQNGFFCESILRKQTK